MVAICQRERLRTEAPGANRRERALKAHTLCAACAREREEASQRLLTAAVSGAAPGLGFAHRADLHSLPPAVLAAEDGLHTRFARVLLDGVQHLVYAVAGVGLVFIAPDLRSQRVQPLPPALQALNFHSVQVWDGAVPRLILTANEAGQIWITDLDGVPQRQFGRPALPPYDDPAVPFKPTDALVLKGSLYVADGYGSHTIAQYDLDTDAWVQVLGGLTEDPTENGRFRTPHGLTVLDGHLLVADRWLSRLQKHAPDGRFVASYPLPSGCWPCAVDVIPWQGRSLAAVPMLYDADPEKQRPAPIMILDAATFVVLAVVRPQAELSIASAQRIHSAVWHVHAGRLHLVCHSWNPGHFFVLENVDL